jgi:hypothetical protein
MPMIWLVARRVKVPPWPYAVFVSKSNRQPTEIIYSEQFKKNGL